MKRDTQIERSYRARLIAILTLASLTLITGSARADFFHVSIETLTNSNLRTYSHGYSYPVAPTTLTVGGVPFDLVPLDSVANSLGIVQTFGTNTITITTNVVSPTTVYTLMNSGYGVYGEDIATVEFWGSGGAFASFDLIEGTNIRDHYNGTHNNIIAAGTPSASFGSGAVRLDRQTFTLPGSFSSDTLTQIVLKGHGGNPQGEAFLAAVTTEAPVPVPVPGAVLLGAIGLSFAGWRLERKAS
jgi:hypothetical protein